MDRERVYTLPFNWSKTVWVITFGYFIFAVVLIGLLVWEIACGGVVGGVLGLVIALPMLVGIALYCEGYSPQRLEISESQITVLRRYDSVTILRSTILSIEPITAKDMRWTVNLGGCGGLFGYFGGFSNRKLGRFTMYATSMDDLLIMRLADGRKIVIGCAEPELLQK
jgi:hypothetical protein